MTDEPTGKAGTERARDLLERTANLLSDYMISFEIMANELQRGGVVKDTDFARTLTGISKTRSQLLGEIKAYERHVLKEGGLLPDAPLDLDAIRAEIGRRLDRFREAQRAKGVSKGA